MTFSDDNIRNLFGNEAADSEDAGRLREYYVKFDIYNRMQSSIPLYLLVGHKGTGKSALFSVLSDEYEHNGDLPIVVKPNDIVEIKKEGVDFLQRIRDWKEGLSRVIVLKMFDKLVDVRTPWLVKVKNIVSPIIGDAALSLNESYLKMRYGTIQKMFSQAAFAEGRVVVFVDDVDRGWTNSQEDIANLSAMINAIRDLESDFCNLKFRVSLRSDVYYSVRTSDETTDKIDGSVVWLKWTNHEIFVMLVKRIISYRGLKLSQEYLANADQQSLASHLDYIFEPRFQGVGHWRNAPMYRVLMSLIRKRPRDLVKLCTLAAVNANKRGHIKIMTDDLEDVFSTYSNDRLLDTGNEYKSEMPAVKELLLAMRPTTKERKERRGSRYTYDELLKKLSNILQNIPLKFSNNSYCDPKALAAFLYKINFITARKQVKDGIQRLYYDENQYIHNQFTNFGYEYEIHPAYRWALKPDDVCNILSEIELDVEA